MGQSRPRGGPAVSTVVDAGRLSDPDAARTLAPAAQAAGAWVVDVSAAFRADGTVPLVLPGLNLEPALAALRGRIVALPSPVTGALAHLLEPLRAAFGVSR